MDDVVVPVTAAVVRAVDDARIRVETSVLQGRHYLSHLFIQVGEHTEIAGRNFLHEGFVNSVLVAEDLAVVLQRRMLRPYGGMNLPRQRRTLRRVQVIKTLWDGVGRMRARVTYVKNPWLAVLPCAVSSAT